MKVIFIIAIFTFLANSCHSVVVKVKNGKLAGTTYTLYNGRLVHAFLGIPYAAPPIGHNRFKTPQPVRCWYGTRDATYARSHCLQLSQTTNPEVTGDENCLYLNVYTPRIPKKSDALMNVMVYIHGGAFMFGSGTGIHPEYIMEKNDLVFVTINYRLGVLGFFSANSPIAPGNYGLKDQVAALQWVKHNIREFGGDPNKVTLFGNSAGGVSVHYHYFSPLSEGLFRNGISSSGSVLTPWARPKNVTEKSIQLASLVGCPTRNKWFMMRCLKWKSAKQIVEATKMFMMWKHCPFTVFGPVVEPRHRNAFLTENPLEMLKNKRVKNLPWMAGVVEKEGLYPGIEIIINDAYLKELNEQWYEIAPNLLQYNFSVSASEKDRSSSTIKQFYFSNNTISNETADVLIQMLGDRLYYNDITSSLKLHTAAVNPANVYCYNFIYRGKFSPYTYHFTRNFDNYGTAHGDDQFYVINSDEKFINKTGKDAEMVELMTSSFIAFMNNGNPNINNIGWSPLVKDNPITCFGIHSPDVQKMEDVVGDCKRNEFWKKLLPSEYPLDAYVECT